MGGAPTLCILLLRAMPGRWLKGVHAHATSIALTVS
jgi:hypothetical protein